MIYINSLFLYPAILKESFKVIVKSAVSLSLFLFLLLNSPVYVASLFSFTSKTPKRLIISKKFAVSCIHLHFRHLYFDVLGNLFLRYLLTPVRFSHSHILHPVIFSFFLTKYSSSIGEKADTWVSTGLLIACLLLKTGLILWLLEDKFLST